jgi:prepilin-type N-terminal cleavage/methylation domain-containing protein
MRPIVPIRSDQRGLTLIELVVSMGVLAFIALSVMTMITTSIHLDKLAQERSVATSLAAERVMQITSMRSQGAADYLNYLLPGETASAGPPPSFSTPYGGIPDYPEFRRTVTFDYDSPLSGMLTIEVEVFWTHVGGEERGHTMIEILDPRLD